MPIQTNYSIKQLEQLNKDIAILTYNEHCEIFNIIRKDTDKLSENNNGVFINLKYLKNETLCSLISFVKYCNNRHKIKKPLEQNIQHNKSVSIEHLYDSYQTVEEEQYRVYDINDNISEKGGGVEYTIPAKSINTVPKLAQFNGIKERIYKKCINKSNDSTKLDKDNISNISSKNDELDLSSNEYLKI